jgi:hexokinase
LGIDGEVPANKSVAVIDAGGTNLRICLARFDEAGNMSLSHFSKQPMPGRDREASADEFYTVLADGLAPMKDQFDQIGFCFSYPAEILPNLDGRLLHWTKEIKIPELVGQAVGAGLLKKLEQRGISGKRVVLLNDTVAALLAGMAQGQRFGASSYVGFILGTGTNTAYVEQNAKIGKLPDCSEGHQIINVESGGFSRFERGVFDEKLDAQSTNPGGHLFEKTISGAYMGSLALELFKALATEGAFSPEATYLILQKEQLSTVFIDNLIAENGRDLGWLADPSLTEKDRETMKTLFRVIVKRASLLAAVNIAAAVVKSGAGKEVDHPVCVNIDGSTYYKTFGMAEEVQKVLGGLLKKRGLHARSICVEDAPVAGAAIAGLLLN